MVSMGAVERRVGKVRFLNCVEGEVAVSVDGVQEEEERQAQEYLLSRQDESDMN